MTWIIHKGSSYLMFRIEQNHTEIFQWLSQQDFPTRFFEEEKYAHSVHHYVGSWRVVPDVHNIIWFCALLFKGDRRTWRLADDIWSVTSEIHVIDSWINRSSKFFSFLKKNETEVTTSAVIFKIVSMIFRCKIHYSTWRPVNMIKLIQGWTK